MGGCVVVGCVSLGFFQLQKGEINEKGRGVGGEYLCQARHNVRGVLWSFVMKRDGGGWVVQKRAILAWRD